jgi:hypothetical protein
MFSLCRIFVLVCILVFGDPTCTILFWMDSLQPTRPFFVHAILILLDVDSMLLDPYPPHESHMRATSRRRYMVGSVVSLSTATSLSHLFFSLSHTLSVLPLTFPLLSLSSSLSLSHNGPSLFLPFSVTLYSIATLTASGREKREEENKRKRTKRGRARKREKGRGVG